MADNTWRTTKLSDVTEYINRGVPPVYTENYGGTAVINQRCIREGVLDYDNTRMTDETVRRIPSEKILRDYDILINSTGTGTVGRVAQIINMQDRSTVDSHVTIVRPKKDVVDPEYLGYWMKSKQKELESLASGSTNQVELSRAKMSEVKVVLPPSDIQRRIVKILSSTDDAIEKTDRINQKSEELKNELMACLFTKGTGHTKLTKSKIGEIPESWRVEKLGEICDVRDGTHDSPKYVSEGYPLVTSKNLTDDGLDFRTANYISEQDYKQIEKRSGVDIGDILLGMIGTIGKPVIVETDSKFAIKNVALIKFCKPQAVNNKYLLYYLKSGLTELQFKKLLGGSTQKFIGLGQMRNLMIALPSMSEQQKMVEILSSIDEKIRQGKEMKSKLILEKNGIMQSVFSQNQT